ncbi:MAG: trypsin-like peptidase domain-containing protein [Clostridiales bacterium]|nr:trypsin-like peptidase domain-containing protein [Clostridiales bacterium]
MDDNNYRKNIFDSNEANRIQQEINRNLHRDSTMPPTSTPKLSEGYYSDGSPVNTSITSDVYSSAAQPSTARLGYEQSTFYHETIKNESNLFKKKRAHKGIAAALIICTLGTGTLGTGIGVGIPLAKNYLASNSIQSENTGNNNSMLIPTIDGENAAIMSTPPPESVVAESLADVIRIVAPSVVSINTVSESTGSYNFGLPSANEEAGSGIIFYQDQSNIYIATNYHVVQGATSVTVCFDDGEEIAASYMGSEPTSDLAVISVKKSNLRSAGITSISMARFGTSDSVYVGQRVIAIGNAMGEGKTATAGIISAVEKEITVEGRTLNVIQTDAAINPGNSGGALVNLSGEVIGINTAKLTQSVIQSNVEGMGYSIMADIAKSALQNILIAQPKPFLGIQGMTMTEDQASILNIPNLGVYVDSIIPGSSAEAAGILRRDIITNFNGAPVFTMEQLTEEIQKCKVGDVVEVRVYRADIRESISFTVTLSEYKTDNF